MTFLNSCFFAIMNLTNYFKLYYKTKMFNLSLFKKFTF